MPYYIKPKLTIISNSSAATTDPGPSALSIALSTIPNVDTSGRLSVESYDHFTINDVPHGTLNWTNVSEWDRAKLIDGSQHLIGGTPGADATSTTSALTGCWVYVKNTTASGSELIHIGHTDDSDARGGGQAFTALSVSNETKIFFTLNTGEFAFFPYDLTGA